MKIKSIVVAIGARLCLAGCFTVDTATFKKDGSEHVVMNNYGWKLFDWIPLFSGNADEDASCGVAFFRDDVTMDKIQARFVKYADGRRIECPAYSAKDTIFLWIMGIPLPYIVTYKEINVSGTMK